MSKLNSTMISRIVANACWLLALHKSQQRSFKRLILKASTEQLACVILCLIIAREDRILLGSSAIKSSLNVSPKFDNTVRLKLCKNEKTIKKALLCVLRRIVSATVNHVISCTC